MRLNTKIIALAIAGVVLVVGLVWGVSVIISNNQQGSSQADPNQDSFQADNQDNQQLEESEGRQKAAIKNTLGKVISVDMDNEIVKVELATGEEVALKAPQEEASFYKQVETGENQYTEEEISRSEIPIDQEVELQYDTDCNELLMLVVAE